MLNRFDLYPGKIVMYNGELARVDKVNPKSVAITRKNGQAWRVGPLNLSEAPEGSTFELDVAEAQFILGAIVRWRANTKNRANYGDTLYVVANVTGEGKARLVKLGGDRNRYFASVPATAVEVVDPKEVLR